MSHSNSNQRSGNQSQLIGFDTTAAAEIAAFVSADRGRLLGNPGLYQSVENFVTAILSDTSKSDEQKLSEGTELLRKFFSRKLKTEHTVDGVFGDYIVLQGRLFNTLKRLARKCSLLWEPWVVENCSMSMKTVQNYMRLARRTDAHSYTFLGEVRLLEVVSVNENSDQDDPIGYFVQKYHINLAYR